jgi:hypothetical protein
MRKLVATALCLTTLAVLAPVFAPPAAAASSESSFVAKINALRASKGLGALQVSSELTGIARSWSQHMAAAGSISHNPNMAGSVSADWKSLGENVGVGWSVESLFEAFVASPAHYANLVDPDWDYIGVGDAAAADGRLFTTHIFMELAGSPPPPAGGGGTGGSGGSGGGGSGGSTGSSGSSSSGSAPKSTTGHASSSSSAHAAIPAEPPPPPARPSRVSLVLTAIHPFQDSPWAGGDRLLPWRRSSRLWV